MFLKANRALSKVNFLFHLKYKTNLVALRKYIYHLQYFKLTCFSIKLQEIVFNACEEYEFKTEREV